MKKSDIYLENIYYIIYNPNTKSKTSSTREERSATDKTKEEEQTKRAGQSIRGVERPDREEYNKLSGREGAKKSTSKKESKSKQTSKPAGQERRDQYIETKTISGTNQ